MSRPIRWSMDDVNVNLCLKKQLTQCHFASVLYPWIKTDRWESAACHPFLSLLQKPLLIDGMLSTLSQIILANVVFLISRIMVFWKKAYWIYPLLVLATSCKAIAILKGHSQLWDRADLDTTFSDWKAFTSTQNQMYALDTSRNLLQSCLVFHSILDLLQKTSFWENFNSSYNIILSCLVKNSIQRNLQQKRRETRGRRAGEIAFVYQNNKRNESITPASKWLFYIFGKSMEKVTYVWKIKLSRSWTFDNGTCRLCIISHLHRWSNSEVFVYVWLFLEKSIGEFSMVYRRMSASALIWLRVYNHDFGL